jgi:hypothetical protein
MRAGARIREGRGGPSAEELAAELDKMDPPEPPAAKEPEDPRLGVAAGWRMIHRLLARVLAEVGPVLKTQVNTHQSYNFRGIDQVLNAVHDIFAKHRVFPTSKISNFGLRDTLTTAAKPTREATLTVTFRFHAPDGSYIETDVPGEALDTSDKATPKAMSVALRIALIQMLLMRTDEPTTDHDYHTRDGVGAMSAAVAALVMERLLVGDLAELIGPVRAALSEHSAWDNPVPNGNGTWWQNYADRIGWLISEISSYPEGKAFKEALTEAKMIGGRLQDGRTFADLLSERGLELREMYAKTLDHVTGQVLKAQGGDELDIAIGCGWAALEAGTILESGLNQALALAEERRPKLPEYAPQPDDDGPEDAAAIEATLVDMEESLAIRSATEDVPFEPPYVPGTEPEDTGHRDGYSREAFLRFKERAGAATTAGLGEERGIRAGVVYAALKDLLTGEEGGVPASSYGTDGFIVVEDAIKAAHRREETIGDDLRARLDDLLREHRELAGS